MFSPVKDRRDFLSGSAPPVKGGASFISGSGCFLSGERPRVRLCLGVHEHHLRASESHCGEGKGQGKTRTRGLRVSRPVCAPVRVGERLLRNTAYVPSCGSRRRVCAPVNADEGKLVKGRAGVVVERRCEGAPSRYLSSRRWVRYSPKVVAISQFPQ